MSERRFIVLFKDGATQPITADSGDQDDEADGYVFFVDSAGGSSGDSLKTPFRRGAKTVTAIEAGLGRRCCRALATFWRKTEGTNPSFP